MTTLKSWNKLIAKKTGINEEDVKDVIDEINYHIERALLQHQSVHLRVGTLHHSLVAARRFRNINTRAVEILPERHLVRFRPGRRFHKKYNAEIDSGDAVLYDSDTE